MNIYDICDSSATPTKREQKAAFSLYTHFTIYTCYNDSEINTLYLGSFFFEIISHKCSTTNYELEFTIEEVALLEQEATMSNNIQDAYWNPTWHMFQIKSFYPVPAKTQSGFGRESSQHFISPLLTSGFPLSSQSTGLIKQGGPVAALLFPTRQTWWMRGELVKDNQALRGPLKRSAEGKATVAF